MKADIDIILEAYQQIKLLNESRHDLSFLENPNISDDMKAEMLAQRIYSERQKMDMTGTELERLYGDAARKFGARTASQLADQYALIVLNEPLKKSKLELKREAEKEKEREEKARIAAHWAEEERLRPAREEAEKLRKENDPNYILFGKEFPLSRNDLLQPGWQLTNKKGIRATLNIIQQFELPVFVFNKDKNGSKEKIYDGLMLIKYPHSINNSGQYRIYQPSAPYQPRPDDALDFDIDADRVSEIYTKVENINGDNMLTTNVVLETGTSEDYAPPRGEPMPYNERGRGLKSGKEKSSKIDQITKDLKIDVTILNDMLTDKFGDDEYIKIMEIISNHDKSFNDTIVDLYSKYTSTDDEDFNEEIKQSLNNIIDKLSSIDYANEDNYLGVLEHILLNYASDYQRSIMSTKYAWKHAL